jgi:uncharacterized protein YjbI with pentapeptide repeats
MIFNFKANEEHLAILSQGVEVWNKWRYENIGKCIVPTLYYANLSGYDLSGASLSNAQLTWANLSKTDLTKSDLMEAKLDGANLSDADLREADLRYADFAFGHPMTNLQRANPEWGILKLG